MLIPFVGCGLGVSAGYREANGEPPAGSSVIYNASIPSDELPPFWVVQYSSNGVSSQRPRLIDVSDPAIYDEGWHFGPPNQNDRMTQGPWDPNSVINDSVSTPSGALSIKAGGGFL